MRHQPQVLAVIAGAIAVLAACGGSDVTVRVLTEGGEEGGNSPVRNEVIEFLPFDRDSVFEALATRADEPEPQVPEEIQTAFDSVARLQEQWRELESQWTEVRDSLRQLSDRLQNMDPRGRDYRQLFERFDQMERRERGLNQQKNQAFERFDQLQRTTLEQADSIRAVREAWEDAAFRDYPDVVDSLLEARGREIHQDTTDNEGYASVRLGGDRWWAHARVTLPFGELYWNVPFNPSETDTLRLTPENAEQRLRL